MGRHRKHPRGRGERRELDRKAKNEQLKIALKMKYYGPYVFKYVHEDEIEKELKKNRFYYWTNDWHCYFYRTGKYANYPVYGKYCKHSSNNESYFKRVSAKAVRKYDEDLPKKGNAYRKVFDYWWTLL